MIAISMPNSIVSDFYYGGVVEVGIFTAEYIAEGIADEVSIANNQLGGMMRMAIYPCGDSAVGYVIAEFSCICSVQYVTSMPLFEC